MKDNIALIGIGGNIYDIYEALKIKNYSVIGYVDNFRDKSIEDSLSLNYLGNDRTFASNNKFSTLITFAGIGKEIVLRKKIGFPLPLEDLFSNEGILNYISNLLKNKKFITFPEILNIDFAAEIANNHLNNKSKNGRLLWTIYNTELWLRSLFD